MIFNACSKKSKIYTLKIQKTHDFWQSHFAKKLPNAKVDKIFSDSIHNSELEEKFSLDFQIISLNITPDIGETYFNMTNRIMFCKNCSIKITETLLYDHITSEEQRDIENYFLLNCMIFVNDVMKK